MQNHHLMRVKWVENIVNNLNIYLWKLELLCRLNIIVQDKLTFLKDILFESPKKSQNFIDFLCVLYSIDALKKL